MTEDPYWLSEAYSSCNLNFCDTGAAQRNLNNLAASWLTAKLAGAKNVLDYGGGDGLLCRLLRDYGINCYVADRNATPTYALGYPFDPSTTKPDLVLSYEVIEHFANPESQLREIFEAGGSVILISTQLYCRQGPQWWYLVPETGQHVFFYSKKALALVARRFGYWVDFAGGYGVFAKEKRLRRKLGPLSIGLHGKSIRILRCLLSLADASGVQADFSEQAGVRIRPEPTHGIPIKRTSIHCES